MKLKITLGLLLLLSFFICFSFLMEAGVFIADTIFAIAKPHLAKSLLQQIDLAPLFTYDRGHFLVVASIIVIVAGLKTWLFWLITRILDNKDVEAAQPFKKKIRQLIFLLSYVALLIGAFSFYGVGYTEWLVKQGVRMPDTQHMQLGGAEVWIFMAVILFVIAQIFKRGIELQTESELTV